MGLKVPVAGPVSHLIFHYFIVSLFIVIVECISMAQQRLGHELEDLLDEAQQLVERSGPVRRSQRRQVVGDHTAARESAAARETAGEQAAVRASAGREAAETQVAAREAVERQATELQIAEEEVAAREAAEIEATARQAAEDQAAAREDAEKQAAERQLALEQAAVREAVERQATEVQVIVRQAAERELVAMEDAAREAIVQGVVVESSQTLVGRIQTSLQNPQTPMRTLQRDPQLQHSVVMEADTTTVAGADGNLAPVGGSLVMLLAPTPQRVVGTGLELPDATPARSTPDRRCRRGTLSFTPMQERMRRQLSL